MKKVSVILVAMLASCSPKIMQKNEFTGAAGEVKLMTLDPGHFHAALVQKTMYDQINANVNVYAPDGFDVKEHLARIEGYNKRANSPTNWKTTLYTGNDYLQKMIADKAGNVMMVAGKNGKKIDYIESAVAAGLNVFADKPLIINPNQFPKLEKVFADAQKKGVMLYDIMTERFEVTTDLQRRLSMNTNLFGTLKDGTADEPAITKESVHHYFKYVSGSPLKRPAWFFDTNEQGEGIVDVTTHLVDLVQWEAFPEQIVKQSDIEMVAAKHWTTDLSAAMFDKVTQLKTYPDYLKKDVQGDVLKVFANGEMTYKIKGKFAKVSVIWNFEAPTGTGDTHYSIMRGTKADLIIKQGKEENFKPTLYIKSTTEDFEQILKNALDNELSTVYQGLKSANLGNGLWRVEIPEKYKIGHEEHFAEVTKNYLKYLKEGKLPDWEIPNMITKYYTTMLAYKMANR